MQSKSRQGLIFRTDQETVLCEPGVLGSAVEREQQYGVHPHKLLLLSIILPELLPDKTDDGVIQDKPLPFPIVHHIQTGA